MRIKTGLSYKIIIPLIILMVLMICSAIPFIGYYRFLDTPVFQEPRKLITFKVTKGETAKDVLQRLEEKEIISSPFYAKIYVKNTGFGKTIKPGIYTFEGSMTPITIFSMLSQGKFSLNAFVFTVPEGFTVKQIARKLIKNGVVFDESRFYEEIDTGDFNYEFLYKTVGKRKTRLEGFLFPATYEFDKKMKPREILDKLLDRFNRAYPGIKAECDRKGMDFHSVIVMASIIEKEAVKDSDRKLIASVFYNRLSRRMKLQSCATLEYALEVHKAVYSLKDTRTISPYNTYRITGLPPGPICNPGMASIKAALEPAATNYLYFVAKGDGENYFTSNYKDFIQHKKLYKQ